MSKSGLRTVRESHDSWTFRKAWKRTRHDPKSPDDFPTNLVGVHIAERRSKQDIVRLPQDKYYACSLRHAFKGPEDRVYFYKGKYLCPICGRPLRQ